MPAIAQLGTILLSLFSKLPQITQNHCACSRGQLSTFAVILHFMGCVSQLFTAVQEMNDPLVVADFTFVLALNLIIAVQMYSTCTGATLQIGRASCRERVFNWV